VADVSSHCVFCHFVLCHFILCHFVLYYSFHMDLLRFITCGSVDDGKSTLIGRLLYDSKSILTDQLAALEKATKGRDDGEIDLALLTDGLRSEREQGITIDVAYRYFQTPARKFIIVDAPGHIQYTRNMVTGASNCGLAIVLIDARHGLIEQTRRHSLICSVLGIPQMVVAVNKMDLVGFDADRFADICADYATLARQLTLPAVTYIPISALNGDNVVDRSEAMPWYTGPTLLEHLEIVEQTDSQAVEQSDLSAGRFPVQYVIRPQTVELPDYRGYAGRIESGQFSVGEPVMVLPSGETSTIQKIEFYGENLPEAGTGQSVILHLTDNRDISRGDLLVSAANPPALSQQLTGTVCWMDSRPLTVGNKYLLQIGTARVRCAISAIPYQLNIETYAKEVDPIALNLNDLGQISLKTARPVPVDSYAQNQATGAAILIDETTNVTVGAVMLG
jgi:sulfate adenylyltransferase subunit 1